MKKIIAFFLLCVCSLTSCNYIKVKDQTSYVDKSKEKNDNKQMVEPVTEITPGVIEQKKMKSEIEENRDTNEDAVNVYDEIDSESVLEDFDNEDSLPDIVYEDGEIPNDSLNYYEYSDDEFTYYGERGEEE